MKRITVFNNSPGTVTVKVMKGEDIRSLSSPSLKVDASALTNVITKQLENYETTDEYIDVDLEVGEMIVIENEGDEYD